MVEEERLLQARVDVPPDAGCSLRVAGLAGSLPCLADDDGVRTRAGRIGIERGGDELLRVVLLQRDGCGRLQLGVVDLVGGVGLGVEEDAAQVVVHLRGLAGRRLDEERARLVQSRVART